MSIFVSIASYCDPVLPFTIERALSRASRPKELHFGIVDQSPMLAPRLAVDGGARLTMMRVDPHDARGACWARAVAMTLYDGEDWFFQIDSHMDFDPGWDETLVGHARALLPGRPGLVISSYPNPFVFEDGQPVPKPVTAGALVHVVKPEMTFKPEHPVLSFLAHPVDSAQPVPGYHLGGGCLFAPGSYVQAFPYDPYLYFHGEEQSMALRLFTHGWDIFHIPGLPVYHLYNTGNVGRPLHWDVAHDKRRGQRWWDLNTRSEKRMNALVAGEPLGIYGLGSVRTVADYAAFSGIDYSLRTIEPRAYIPRGARPAQAPDAAAAAAAVPADVAPEAALA